MNGGDNYGSDGDLSENLSNNSESQVSGYGDDNLSQQGSENEMRGSKSMQNEDNDQIQSIHSNETENQYEILQEQNHPQKANEERITSPFLTKYQKAKIIGIRAVQISKNSPLYLNIEHKSFMNWDPLTIAEKQLTQQKIPFIIRRYLPDSTYEDWKLSELKTFD